jgi:hypothetical protein
MLPNTFVEIWKNTKIVGRAKHNSSLIFYGDKAALVELQLSDDVNCMFYGYKVAKCFGFKNPTRVMLDFDTETNFFTVMGLADIDSQESGTNPPNPDIIEIQSSDDERDHPHPCQV